LHFADIPSTLLYIKPGCLQPTIAYRWFSITLTDADVIADRKPSQFFRLWQRVVSE